MKVYVISLAVGLLVGALYSVLNVRSPAPPVVALVGLLGILLGEQLPPLARHLFGDTPASVSSLEQIKPRMLGRLPPGQASEKDLQ